MTLPCWSTRNRAHSGKACNLAREPDRSGEQTEACPTLSARGTGVGEDLHETECECHQNSGIWQQTGGGVGLGIQEL